MDTTNEAIAQNNKIIAEFMGYEIAFGDTSQPCIMGKQNAWTPIKYHSDWNWLMEVVEKVERYCYDEIGTEFKIDIFAGSSIFIPKTKDSKSIHIRYSYIDSPKIEAVYNACLEFIKWYNENSAKEIKNRKISCTY